MIKGSHHTEETKEKLRRIVVSKETRAEMSRVRKGRTSPKKGKKANLSIEGLRSLTKAARERRGEKHWNWQGGKTPLVMKIRNSYEYRQWRSDVYTRDDFTCQQCCHRGGDLEAHHIILLSTLLQKYELIKWEQVIKCAEIWNINNGMTFCVDCHRKEHSRLRIHSMIERRRDNA